MNEPASKESILALLSAIEMQKTFTVAFLQMFKKLLPDSENEAHAFLNKIDWLGVSNKMVEVYQNYFNQKEVEELICFYTSPAFKKYLEKQAVIAKDLDDYMGKMFTEIAQEIFSEFSEKELPKFN